MRFMKMQGLGNDYVYVDCFSQKMPATSDATPNMATQRSSADNGMADSGASLLPTCSTLSFPISIGITVTVTDFPVPSDLSFEPPEYGLRCSSAVSQARSPNGRVTVTDYGDRITVTVHFGLR